MITNLYENYDFFIDKMICLLSKAYKQLSSSKFEYLIKSSYSSQV
jgi:hypothetical protein